MYPPAQQLLGLRVPRLIASSPLHPLPWSPQALWTESDPFVPVPDHHCTFNSLDTLAEEVCRLANSDDPPQRYSIRGNNIAEVSAELDRLLDEAGHSGDYTKLLSPVKSFVV